MHASTEFMSLELFKKILGDLTPAYGGHIGLYLHYEPLLDSRLPDLITLTKEMCPMSCVALSTNAALLDEELGDRLCQSPLDLITFNVNGGTKETYEKMMPPLKWDRTTGNIKHFLKKYKKRRDINFIKTNDNFNESELLKGIFPEVKIVDQYWAVNRGGSVEINKPMDVKSRFKSGFKKCTQLSTNLSIICDGSILLCCNCWKKEVILGNANNVNIIDIWNDNPLKHYHHAVCSKCC